MVAPASGAQNCCVHMLSGGVQMPQLALQQTSPALQVVGPHATPLPFGEALELGAALELGGAALGPGPGIGIEPEGAALGSGRASCGASLGGLGLQATTTNASEAPLPHAKDASA